MKYGFNRDGNKKGFLERKLQTALQKKNKNQTSAQRKQEEQNDERIRELKKAKLARQIDLERNESIKINRE